MKFKNIQSRKDFIKMNEIFGGTQGGVGSRDGFANNADLKDTYLGKLMNGLFKGLSWLWRKSKENFIINRLIAKLINELIRGVIVYCFIKKIDLQSGKISEEENQENKESNENENEVSFESIKKDIGEDLFNKMMNGSEGEDVEELIKKSGIKTDNDIPIIKSINDVKEVIDKEEYDKMKTETYEFLKKNIQFFDDIKKSADEGDEESKKKLDMIKAIYVNYEIVKKLKEKETKNEKAPDEASVTNEALAKLRTDSSAGKIGIDSNKPTISPAANPKSIIKSFVSVKSIITKRDQDKYKEREADFSLPISSINLAEIEKTIARNDAAMKEVSSNVNSESLKVIQLTAKDLFVTKEQNVETEKLKLRWDKELSKVYASFSLLMDIPSVDIREGSYGSGLNLSGTTIKANKEIKKFENDSESLKIGDNLGDSLNQSETKIGGLEGNWQYCIFEYQGINYNATIAPISSAPSNGFYMFMITQTIKKIENNIVTSNFKEFEKLFSSTNFANVNLKKDDVINIYFMLKKGASLPSGTSANTNGQSNSFLVFNNYISSDNQTNKLFLCEPSGEKFIADLELSNPSNTFDGVIASNYQKDKINIKSCRKFDRVKFWWKALNFITDSNDKKFCAFKDEESSPKFWDNKVVLDNLKKIASKF